MVDIRIQRSKNKKRLVSDKYIDKEGNKNPRVCTISLQALDKQYVEAITQAPGFDNNSIADLWLRQALSLYDRGDYSKALQYFTWLLDKISDIEPHIFYYMRVCNRVILKPLFRDEIEYEIKLDRYRSLPKWLRWMVRDFDLLIGCKWCGEFTTYINQVNQSAGMTYLGNNCDVCKREYPMPSGMWDSPDGRAYNYYQGSIKDKAFYEEFEKDYDPRPIPAHRTNKSPSCSEIS